MAGEWTTLRLGGVCSKIGSGATPRGGSSVYLNEGDVALIRSQNVYNDGFRQAGLAYLTKQHAAELENVEVSEQDVLLNITGDSVARVCQVDPRFLPARVNQHVAIIRPDPAVLCPRYLRYYLVSPGMQAHMLSLAGAGATRNALTKGIIESFEVPAPVDVAEQRAIAHILGTLDDKIELNRRMNETLEGIARALFKSWFVDFDPVRAKAEGRDSGLPGEIADLFPAGFEASELGEIPRGWSVGALGGLVTVTKGRSYTSSELIESDTALVTLKSFARGGGYRSDGLKSFAGAYKPEQALAPGDLVIACTDVTQAAEVIGRPAMVRRSNRYARLVASLDTAIVRPRDDRTTLAFLYLLCGNDRFADHTYAHTSGTTVLHLSKEAIPSFAFAQPPETIVRAFDFAVAPIFRRLDGTEMESETWAALRDTLLPKLISGEIRVKDAERMVEEVA